MIYFVLPFRRIIYCLNCLIINISIFVVQFRMIIFCLSHLLLWLMRIGYIFIVPFGKLLYFLLPWCFWLKIFGVPYNFVLSVVIDLILFDIYNLLKLPFSLPSSDNIPVIVGSDLRNQKRQKHHVSAEIFTLLFPFSVSCVAWKWFFAALTSRLFLWRGKNFYFVSFLYYLPILLNVKCHVLVVVLSSEQLSA